MKYSNGPAQASAPALCGVVDAGNSADGFGPPLSGGTLAIVNPPGALTQAMR